MIIDSHAHIFPAKIAQKASGGIAGFYDMPVRYNGSEESLIDAGKRAGVNKFIVHSVATSPGQVSVINDYIADAVSRRPEFIGFAAIHQDTGDIEAELNRVMGLGLRGVKLHPDFQRISFDDPKMDRVYAAIEGKLPLLVHTGDSRFNFSNPARLVYVLDKFPGLDVICAHFGGYSEWDDAAKHLAGRRLWVDTSSSLPFLSRERALELIDAFGADNVFFGTDYPMWDASQELDLLYKLNLPEERLEKILYKNICALLKIPF